MKRITWALLLAFASIPVRAEEAEIPDAKAATEIIESLQGTLGNLSAVINLPPEQRVDWVLTKASARVQEKIAEKAQEQIKEAMDNYAKAAFQAQAFKTIAVPALQNAAVLRTSVDWDLLNSQMDSKVDTKMAAYGVAVTGVSIAWDSIDAFSNEGAQAGFSKMAAGVYDAVADAYIPGWGWFKLGKTMVEGLGNYVLGYATDTATEGMLNDMFDMKGNPKAFGQMLRTKALPDINKIIDDDWELVSYGRLWPGKGTDAGNEAQKQVLKDAILRLKAGVAHEYTEQQRKEAELQAAFRPYLDAAAQAEEKLKVAAGKAKAEAEPLLATTRDFKRRANQLWEEKSERDAIAYNVTAVPKIEDELPLYMPVPRGGLLSMVTACWAQFKEEMGGSFDEEAFYADWSAVTAARTQLWNSQTPPPETSKARYMWLVRQDYDFKSLGEEGNAIVFAARQREAIMVQAIDHEIRLLIAKRNELSEKLDQGLVALEDEAAEVLSVQDTFRRYCQPGMLGSTANWIFNNGLTDEATQRNPTAYNYERIAPYLEKLEADAEVLPSLNARRRALYADYATFMVEADAKMKAIIPDGCLVITNVALGSEKMFKTWSSSFAFGGQLQTFSAGYVRPELVEPDWFDSRIAIDVVKRQLAALQAPYDRWQLEQALQRVAKMLDQKFQPFDATKPANFAGSLVGRVDGILDYRQPLERTDLFLHVQKLEDVWLAAQSRVELLQRHPTMVDATPYLKWGTILNQYKASLAADQDDRKRAPTQAESLKATIFQPAISRWTPIGKEMTPEYYEDALGGLAGTLSNAETYYMRARSATTPTLALMVEYFRNYIPQVTSLLQQAQTEYTRIAPWYSKTMPAITPSASKVLGAVGQLVSASFNASVSGGTYSAISLPAGLVVDPTSGAISGRVAQAGAFGAYVRYQSPAGVTTFTSMQLEVEPPAGATQALAINNGFPEIKFQGIQDVNYSLQIRDDLASDNRWVTIKTIGANQSWTDTEGLLGTRFYRLVWIQPTP